MKLFVEEFHRNDVYCMPPCLMNVIPAKAGIQKKGSGVFSWAEGAAPGMTVRRYSGETGIHSQDDAGKDLGLGGALVQGGQLVANLNQFMMSHFGEGYLWGGDIAVSFIKPARPGDILTSKGVVKEIKSEGENSRVLCDVWLENQNGEKVTVGVTSALIRN